MTRFFVFLLIIFTSQFSHSSIIYVNVNAVGLNNGTSWANAYTNLQSALSIAFINDDIWVAGGTYKPTATNDRTISFVMKNGVDIFGGFNGTETSLSERNITANPTYLSGDIGAQGDNTDNTTKVVKIQNFTAPFTFDGFRVISGYDASSSGKGAGMYLANNSGSQITIKNTILYNNYAYDSGGGMIVDNSNTTFYNCEFLYNSSYSSGGGAIYSGNGSNAKIYLNDCKFIGNNSRQGPVINFDGIELVMERNLVSNNTSTTSGNIINVTQGPTKFEINNSLIVGNQVPSGVNSIISSYTSGVNSSSLTNVTICHNKHNTTFDITSEAIHQSNSAMNITNCIIFGNTNSDMNVQIDPGNNVRNCIVENGYSTGVNISTSNPLFVNPGTLASAPFDGLSLDYSLQSSSPGVNFGDNTFAQNFSLDYINGARIQQGIVDCGAIESPFTDTQAPVANCSNTTVYLNSNGLATLVPSAINNGSSDNLGITNLSLSETVFDCSNIGQNQVTLTVADAAGNTDFCVSTVTVLDQMIPSLQIQNFSVNLDLSGNASISVDDIDLGTTDNCSIDTMFISQSQFNCSDVGQNSITFTAIDVYGNQASQNVIVTVIDTVYPTAIAQNKTIHLNASGTASITAAQIDNGSFDDCGIQLKSLSKTNFNCTNLGQNQVTLSIKDFYGNTSTAIAQITVLDTLKPVTIGQNLVLNLFTSNPAIVTVNAINNGSYDNCSYTQTVNPSTFTTTGTYNVVLTSTDGSGNSSSAIYQVEIIDSATSSVNELENETISISPNPTQGKINIKINANENPFMVQLFDLNGRLIQSKTIENKSEFDLIIEGESGIYFLELTSPVVGSSKNIKILKI
jgi:hypothetical protein